MKSPVIAALSTAAVLAIGVPILLDKHSADEPDAATTIEVQEFDRLCRDLEAVQNAPTEPGGARFKQAIMSLTSRYLNFDKDQRMRFTAIIDHALSELKDAQSRMRTVEQESAMVPSSREASSTRREGWGRWRQQQRTAADGMLAVLQSTPRHRLFAEKRLLWLLRLDHGLRRAGATVR